MQKLLVVTGDIATGKSTFSRILSERYKINVFAKDTIKEVLGDTIGFSNREENKKLSNASMRMMFFLFSEFGKLGKDLILESNFHTEEHQQIHELVQKNNYEVLTIALFGAADILYNRYILRAKNGNRHPVHLSSTLDVFDDFKEYSEHMNRVTIPGNVIRVKADDFAYQRNGELLERIDSFMSK